MSIWEINTALTGTNSQTVDTWQVCVSVFFLFWSLYKTNRSHFAVGPFRPTVKTSVTHLPEVRVPLIRTSTRSNCVIHYSCINFATHAQFGANTTEGVWDPTSIVATKCGLFTEPTITKKFFVFTTSWRHLWSITEQAHGNMESIC